MVIEDQQSVATGNGSASPRKPIPILLTVRELHHGGIERDRHQLEESMATGCIAEES